MKSPGFCFKIEIPEVSRRAVEDTVQVKLVKLVAHFLIELYILCLGLLFIRVKKKKAKGTSNIVLVHFITVYYMM